jgi:hypothetical protein
MEKKEFNNIVDYFKYKTVLKKYINLKINNIIKKNF